MGSLYGGYLAKAGEEVYLVDIWQQHVDEINNKGLSILEKDEEVVVYPKAVTSPENIGQMDLAIIFVKSILTSKAVKQNISMIGPKTWVLSLQNGYGNIEAIEEHVSKENIIAGTTAHGGTMLEAGKIKHAGIGDTHIGLVEGKDSAGINEVAEVLKKAGFNTVVSSDVIKLIWDKLIINVGINALTALLKVKNGELLDLDETKLLMEKAVFEAVDVAAAKGVIFDKQEILEKVKMIAEKTCENKSSMLQDVLNKRKTEIDTINGAIVKEAMKLSMETPVNLVLTNLIKAIEQKY